MGLLFLIDESLSPNLAKSLRDLGYDSKAVREVKLKGADDIRIVEWAIKNNAVIITGDLDFGELWYWYYNEEIGIIILRIKSYIFESQYQVIKFLHELNILKSDKINKSLIISTSSRYRIRTKLTKKSK